MSDTVSDVTLELPTLPPLVVALDAPPNAPAAAAAAAVALPDGFVARPADTVVAPCEAVVGGEGCTSTPLGRCPARDLDGRAADCDSRAGARETVVAVVAAAGEEVLTPDFARRLSTKYLWKQMICACIEDRHVRILCELRNTVLTRNATTAHSKEHPVSNDSIS
jgi:hypothetical protein